MNMDNDLTSEEKLMRQYITDMIKYLMTKWGLAQPLAKKTSVLLLVLSMYDIRFTITSGYRSEAKQAELLRRWEKGDPGVLVKPATDSKHCVTRNGKPYAMAVDITTSNQQLAVTMAERLGIKNGAFFSTPDPVHFYI